MSVFGGGDSETRPEERKQSAGAIPPAEGEQDAPGQTRPELLPPSCLRAALPVERVGSLLEAFARGDSNW